MADAPLLQGSWASVLLVLPDAPAPLIYLGVVDLNKGGRKKQRENRQNKENNIVFAVNPPPPQKSPHTPAASAVMRKKNRPVFPGHTEASRHNLRSF